MARADLASAGYLPGALLPSREYRIQPGTRPPYYRLLISLLLAGLSFSLLLTHDFGQREHFFLIYATPWILMRFCAWEGKRFRSLSAVVFGALVGIASAAKPYYFVVVGAIELYCLLRYRRLRPLQSYEFLGFIIANLIYLGLIVREPGGFPRCTY